MKFTVEVWKKQVEEQLRKLGHWFERRVTEDAPCLLYGYLCGLTLLPLIAAARTGQLLPGMVALGNLVEGVGGNLLANQLQTWKDQADEVTEAQVAEWVAEHASTNSDLRQALDSILQTMETIPQAPAALNEAQRELFVDTLRAELVDLGNVTRFEIALVDSGAIAQGPKAKAAGKRAVITDDMHQSIVATGDNNSISYILNQYLGRGGQKPKPAILRRQIDSYLTWLQDRCGTIELSGIKREGQQVMQLPLNEVYVPLEAYSFQDSRSIETKEVLGLGRRIVITGGPGSGKTTVLLHIAWAMALAITYDSPTFARKKLGFRDTLFNELKAILEKAYQLVQREYWYENHPLLEGLQLDRAHSLATQLAQVEADDPLPAKIKLAQEEVEKVRTLVRKAEEARGTLRRADERLFPDKIGEAEKVEAAISDARALALGKKDSLPLPIFIPLNAYAAHLRGLPDASDPYDTTLAAFISRHLIEKQSSFDLSHDFFQQILRDGRAVILLLDGLDEVPNEAERVRVREAIEELVTGRPTMWVVVTCRTVAYRERTALGKGFQEVRVHSLDDDHVEALVRRACTHLYPHDAKEQESKATDLLRGIMGIEAAHRRRFGENVERLISSPLLVRMLIVVYFSERRLPEQRAELYLKATDVMLLPEYAPDQTVAEELGRQVGGSKEIHRELVQHLAFAMHSRGESQGREITEDELRRILKENPAYVPLIDDLIALTRTRGTVLEERLSMYRFIHLAFQEFLAARYLAEIVRGEAGVEGIATFFEDGPILDSWWREPALLVAGYLSVVSPQIAQMFMRRMARLDQTSAKQASGLSAEVQLATSEAACAAFLEWPSATAELGRALAERIVALFQQPGLLSTVRPSLRTDADCALARLGDPRPNVGLRSDGLPEIAWSDIPAGSFLRGSDQCKDPQALDNETPQQIITLPAFQTSIYPITSAQYEAFIKDDGYTAKWQQCWTDSGWLWKKDRTGPETYDGVFDLPNHPVVGVSWYEAVAFCGWLTRRLRERGEIGIHEHVTLPSESQWEKAARGSDGRLYPWGDEADCDKANCRNAGIGTTSVVGCFPGGASPCDCMDMAGNVWEWCRTKWQDNYQDYQDDNDLEGDDARVLRGGSWDDHQASARCACRIESDPHNPKLKLYNIGFRVVISPA
jgi:formylglycine-generating enzyme required for sulfatase activity